MKFEKAPFWIVEAFEHAFRPTGGELRKMFGYPAGFVNGHMCCGVFGKSIFVRLSDVNKTALLAQEGAGLFDPMGGRPMKDYVVIPPALVDEPGALEAWFANAVEHTRSLPPKEKKAKPVARAARAKKAPAARGKKSTIK